MSRKKNLCFKSNTSTYFRHNTITPKSRFVPTQVLYVIKEDTIIQDVPLVNVIYRQEVIL